MNKLTEENKAKKPKSQKAKRPKSEEKFKSPK